MRRFTKLRNDVPTATDPQPLPATASEMTLHDVLRICSGRVRNDSPPPPPRTALRQVGVCRYHSESDLYDQWNGLHHALRQTANLTVILVLADFLRDNLRDIVRRPGLARRLVIVPHVGHWPGIDSFGDLVLSATSLGWNSIELCRDLRESPIAAAMGSRQDETLILVVPASATVGAVV